MATALSSIGTLCDAGAVSGAGGKGTKVRGASFDLGQLLGIGSAAQTTAVPMATLIQNVAGQAASLLMKAAGTPDDANARSTLQRALAAALAPPGAGPPATAGDLERRLTSLLTRLAGGQTDAGQQNDIPGNLLDAKAAKESPAQQKTTTADRGATALDAASFARSLVAQAAAQSAAQSGTGAQAPLSSALQTFQQNAAASASLTAANAAAPAPEQNDVLSRIVSRAVNAGAQRSGTASPATPSASPLAKAGGGTGVASPAQLFAKLTAAIASANASDGDANTGKQAGHDAGQGPAQLPSAAKASDSLLATAAAQPASSTPAATSNEPSSGAATYTGVDANAVIEQLVKGISVNSISGTSQIRLRLQPEHLGDVSVKLTVTGTDVSASVVAQNPNVREALLGAQSQLSRALSEAGLSLGSFSVDVSGGNAGSPDGERHSERQGAAFKIGGWQAAAATNDGQALSEAPPIPALSGIEHALAINSLA